MNIEDKNRNFNSEVDLRNNMPLDDFEGRTPKEMFNMIHNPFGKDSPLIIARQVETEVLDRIPLLTITEMFLKFADVPKGMKLTAKGNMPVTIVKKLYDVGLFPNSSIESGFSKIRSEKDVRAIHTMNILCEMCELVKKQKGHLILTKKGRDIIRTDNKLELFREIVKTYTTKFNWPYNDRYGESPVGQMGFAFSLELVSKYGEKFQSGKFYAEKYLRAFPMILDKFVVKGYGTKEEEAMECYVLRVFRHFLKWFGMVEEKEAEAEGRLFERLFVRKTDVLDKVFQFEE